MTTTLTPASTDAPAKVLGGIARTTLRLHRWALWLWTAYVALGTGLLLWARGPAANELRSLLASCDTGTTVPDACLSRLDAALGSYETLLRTGSYVILLIPFLVGAWAAAALTAREMETGTAHLAWTQSVTPARWLTAKLALPAVAVTAGTTLLLALYRLTHIEGSGPFEAVTHATRSPWGEDFFTGMGVVMVPRVLCGVAVGVLLGLLLRRTLASLGTGLLLMATGTASFTAGRQHLWPAEIRYGYAEDESSPRWDTVNDEWPMDSGAVTRSGELVGYDYGCLDAVHPSDGPPGDADDFYACLRADGYTDVWVTYHPEDHFWPLQLVESGIWLAVAALAVFLSYRVLRRRTA
ncbi:ABC transporter permease [Streptomyces chilikensis]|uniref:ABC transporter permease n=1 Tax=Streptomyces chilikensis TaxID=1194079 RepID=UPI000ADF0B1A|nr:ABC transporter permease [Streptomyces chilikensis]